MIIHSDLFQNTEHRKLGGNSCHKLFFIKFTVLHNDSLSFLSLVVLLVGFFHSYLAMFSRKT